MNTITKSMLRAGQVALEDYFEERLDISALEASVTIKGIKSIWLAMERARLTGEADDRADAMARRAAANTPWPVPTTTTVVSPQPTPTSASSDGADR